MTIHTIDAALTQHVRKSVNGITNNYIVVSFGGKTYSEISFNTSQNIFSHKECAERALQKLDYKVSKDAPVYAIDNGFAFQVVKTKF